MSTIVTFRRYMLFCAAFLCLTTPVFGGEKNPERPPLVEARSEGPSVPDSVMRSIYEQVKTPYKYGIVLRGEQGHKVDCPSVFRHERAWYMVYIIFDGTGYETALARSEDLLEWSKLGKILRFRDGTWDAHQVGGYIALQDYRWGGSSELGKHEGRYWLSYLGGALQGYETDPLSMGMAWTNDPSKAEEWTRIPENPILTRDQPDAREFERQTLYKSHILHDKAESLGYPFVMYYNGKRRGDSVESIGMAVSKDMVHWARYGRGPIITAGKGISGDPQVTRIGDVWVLFYFGHAWKPKAFDTFACSYDLANWRKWEGPHLVEPSEPWDATYAHKPWVLKHEGVVYHFYCAVGNEGRVIALATSTDLREEK